MASAGEGQLRVRWEAVVRVAGETANSGVHDPLPGQAYHALLMTSLLREEM